MTKGPGELSVGEVRLTSTGRSHLARLEFKVFSHSGTVRKSLAGLEVAAQLSRELEADPELLGVSVLSVETVVCQNTCGGHGQCDQATRECLCQPAWIENFLSRRLLAGGKANCDWSIVYVGLVSGSATLLTVLCCCMTTCKKKIVKIRTKTKYRRLNTSDAMELGGEAILSVSGIKFSLCFTLQTRWQRVVL